MCASKFVAIVWERNTNGSDGQVSINFSPFSPVYLMANRREKSNICILNIKQTSNQLLSFFFLKLNHSIPYLRIAYCETFLWYQYYTAISSSPTVASCISIHANCTIVWTIKISITAPWQHQGLLKYYQIISSYWLLHGTAGSDRAPIAPLNETAYYNARSTDFTHYRGIRNG